MSHVELRSDTFTSPTPEMRRAMAEAVVGDDVWGEDPTANDLERHCAELLGKQAAVFVPTGSMGNEIAIKALTNPGEEIIAEESSHIVDAEVGAPATISNVMVRTLRATRGVFDIDELASSIRPKRRFYTQSTLLCLENTHQDSGGAVVPIEAFREMTKVARDHGLRVHLDGARIWNASVASGVPARDYAAEADTVMFCFSKGLGAPVGSIVVGDADVIDRARTARKMLGGGMRQVGVLCAAARVAIDTGVARLHDDHVNARRLADGVASVWPEAVDPASVETNIVYVDTGDRDAAELAAALAGHGVKVGALSRRRIRMVTHSGVDAAGVERAIEAYAAVLRA